jgi:hypothetical protein
MASAGNVSEETWMYDTEITGTLNTAGGKCKSRKKEITSNAIPVLKQARAG